MNYRENDNCYYYDKRRDINSSTSYFILYFPCEGNKKKKIFAKVTSFLRNSVDSTHFPHSINKVLKKKFFYKNTRLFLIISSQDKLVSSNSKKKKNNNLFHSFYIVIKLYE